MLEVSTCIDIRKEICFILSNICGGKIKGLK